MKKHSVLIAVLLAAALLCVGVTACGGGGGGGGGGGAAPSSGGTDKFAGEWTAKLTNTDLGDGTPRDYDILATFKDGKGKIVLTTGGAEAASFGGGKYEANGDKITMYEADNTTPTFGGEVTCTFSDGDKKVKVPTTKLGLPSDLTLTKK